MMGLVPRARDFCFLFFLYFSALCSICVPANKYQTAAVAMDTTVAVATVAAVAAAGGGASAAGDVDVVVCFP